MALDCYKAMYLWYGKDYIKPYIKDLKQIQKVKLEEYFNSDN